MDFKRKAYQKLLDWKNHYAKDYAVLLEGARRVGKSTIAENFAKNEYKSYILIDFSNCSKDILNCFDDISNLDLFYLHLQTLTGTDLFINESVIIFDEIQLFPKARQAIKHFVKDGRYHFIETGSLISIKKNVKDILIPSEEMKIQVYPMDYEEFCYATNISFSQIKNLYEINKPLGQTVNRKLMRDIRIYMAVGGMPQAVEAYIQGKNFSEIDQIKRQIIMLYEDDFKKIDSSGRISAMYHSIPSQLSKNTKRFLISKATNKRKSLKDEKLFFNLLDSKTVLPCFNITDPNVTLSSSKDLSNYKLYLADTGLFVTLMFFDRPTTQNELYAKLLSDKLPANLGYLYENLVAQILTSQGRELYYHTWEKENSTHYYEVDFLISQNNKVSIIEVKSSSTGIHASLNEFSKKYSKVIKNSYIVCQKDFEKIGTNIVLPVYMSIFI